MISGIILDVRFNSNIEEDNSTMNFKNTLLAYLDIGVKEEESTDIVFRVRLVNLDSMMGIAIPIFALLVHFTGTFVFHSFLINLLFTFPVVCLIALWFTSRYQYNTSSIIILSYFLIAIPWISFLLGEEANVHFLLIAVSISGFIYFLENKVITFSFFGAYLGMFVLMYFVDFELFFCEKIILDEETMGFTGKICIICLFWVLAYKIFGLVLIYEYMLKSARESEALFRNLYNYNPVGITIGDSKGVLTQANPTFNKILGYSDSELVGKEVSDISHPDDIGKERRLIRNLISGKSDDYVIEKRYRTKKGEYIWSTLSIAVARNEDQEVDYVIGMIEDISDRKKQEEIIESNIQELNNKNIELEKYIESNMQLENFAYIASHDLKEPICSIQGLVDLLDMSAETRLTDEEKEYIELLKKSTENMQRLIEDLLAYSRVNSDQFNFDIVNIDSLIQTICFDLRAKIEEKGAKFEVLNLPIAIKADAVKIRQLLQNLITNGLKFQEEGVQPVVKISCMDTEMEWIFEVKDNGIGIQPEFHEKIFLLFRRLHSRSEFEGTGIGLAICKKIVEQHGGRIWLESAYGEGTSFFFSISKKLR